MKNVWNFQDIIDLEYLAGLDLYQDGSEEEMHQRDRSFFLEAMRNGEVDEAAPHPRCLAAWLAHRRLAESHSPHPFLPGEKLRGALQSFTLLLLVFGLVIGYGTGLSYFAYTGRTPLNVFIFFIIFLLPQLLLIVIFLLKKFTAALARKPRISMHRILRPLFAWFVRFAGNGSGDLREEQKRSFNQLFSEKNRRLFSRSLFVRGQIFGISFNIGLLAVTLFKITTTDLAFGWQTTLQIGAEGLHGLVRLLALPWSWLLPAELAYPGLAQIEGSRIILKEGIYNLLTEDLTSWWPFLLMSLLFYGLLPRILLFLYGVFMERRNMTRLLRQRKFQAVISRMRTPLVTSQAAEEDPGPEISYAELRLKSPQSVESSQQQAEALVLVPEETAELFDKERLKGLLLPHGYLPVERRVIFRTYEDDQSIITEIGAQGKPVIVLFEAWMPPIREHLLFLKNLSTVLDPARQLAVCLLGKPGKDGVLSPPSRQEILLWREKISECCDVAAVFQAGASPGNAEEHQS